MRKVVSALFFHVILCVLALVPSRGASADQPYALLPFGAKFGVFPHSPEAINSTGAILADGAIIRGRRIEYLPEISPVEGGTQYTGINADLTTTGYAMSEDFELSVGFIRRSNGQISVVNVPGSNNVFPLAISDRGSVVGNYYDEFFNDIGFFADQNGVKTVTVPGALATFPKAVNNADDIVGVYLNENFEQHAFLMNRHGFTQLVPDAIWSVAWSINTNGQVVGSYADESGETHGFLYDRGKITILDYTIPGLPDEVEIDLSDLGFGVQTFVRSHAQDFRVISGINSRGEIVGWGQFVYVNVDPFGWIPGFSVIDSFWGSPSP